MGLKVNKEKSNELINNFLSDKRDSTKETYLKEIRLFHSFILPTNLVDVTKEDAAAYRDYLQKKMNSRHYTKTTIIKKLRILLSFYKFLLLKGYIESNPFHTVKIPEQGTIGNVQDALTENDLNRLMKSVENHPRNNLLLHLIITSRMTPVQITNLKWGDFLMDGMGLFGAQVLSRGGKKRFVAIHRYVIKKIMPQYRTWLGKNEDIKEEEADEYVFSKGANSPISNLRKIAYSMCDKAGVKKSSPMDLAHTGVFLMKRFNATDNQIQSQAGFHHISVLRKYDNPIHELHEQACHVIDIDELHEVIPKNETKK